MQPPTFHFTPRLAGVSSAPISCPNGTYSLSGATACSICPVGIACINGAQVSCVAGAYVANTTTHGQACTPCPPGHACADASSPPSVCSPGSYAVGEAAACTREEEVACRGWATARAPTPSPAARVQRAPSPSTQTCLGALHVICVPWATRVSRPRPLPSAAPRAPSLASATAPARSARLARCRWRRARRRATHVPQASPVARAWRLGRPVSAAPLLRVAPLPARPARPTRASGRPSQADVIPVLLATRVPPTRASRSRLAWEGLGRCSGPRWATVLLAPQASTAATLPLRRRRALPATTAARASVSASPAALGRLVPTRRRCLSRAPTARMRRPPRRRHV